MTVLHIITRLILGGAQQNTIASCKDQVERGHQVTLAYGPIYGPEGSLVKEALGNGAELVRISSLRRSILPIHDLRCYWDLRRLIRKVRPDIVHTHSSKAGIVGRAAAWHEHVPGVIHTIHGLAFHDRQPALVHQAYVMAERWASRRCHRIIGVAQAMCDSFAERGIGRTEQFCVIPSGIDVRRFESSTKSRDEIRRELGLAMDTPVIAVVARLDALKGQEDLIDILPGLLQTHPNIHLLLIGDGFYRSSLEAKIQRHDLADKITLTGLVSPQRVVDLLHAVELMALPSYQEGSPRTLAQALAAGCAIVGYDVGGIPEICVDGKTGRLVTVGDREALREAIRWLLDHPQVRQTMVAAGRQLVRERFDVHNMVQRIEDVYRNVLEASTSGKAPGG